MPSKSVERRLALQRGDDPARALARKIAKDIWLDVDIEHGISTILPHLAPVFEALRIGGDMSDVLFSVKQTNADEPLRELAERLQSQWDRAMEKIRHD